MKQYKIGNLKVTLGSMLNTVRVRVSAPLVCEQLRVVVTFRVLLLVTLVTVLHSQVVQELLHLLLILKVYKSSHDSTSAKSAV